MNKRIKLFTGGWVRWLANPRIKAILVMNRSRGKKEKIEEAIHNGENVTVRLDGEENRRAKRCGHLSDFAAVRGQSGKYIRSSSKLFAAVQICEHGRGDRVDSGSVHGSVRNRYGWQLSDSARHPQRGTFGGDAALRHDDLLVCPLLNRPAQLQLVSTSGQLSTDRRLAAHIGRL